MTPPEYRVTAAFYAGSTGGHEVEIDRAAIYLRISQDRTGLHAGVQRQQEDCLALADQFGFSNPRVFIDNDVSAFNGRRRPGYDALVTGIRAGVSRVVVWHVSKPRIRAVRPRPPSHPVALA